jgi:hypothetical protein
VTLTSQRIVIIGGSSGMGLATARAADGLAERPLLDSPLDRGGISGMYTLC